MKISILTNYGLDSKGGGVRVYTLNLVQALEKSGYKVLVLFRVGTPAKSGLKLPTNKILYLFKAIHKLNISQSNYIVSQGGWFTAIPAMIYKLKNPSARAIFIYHTHHSAPATFIQWFIRSGERLLMSFILSKFDMILFVSKGLRRNIEENGALNVRTNWKVLYGAPKVEIPTQKEMNEFITKFRISSNRLYILAHGLTASYVKAQGAKLLIRTLKLLPDNISLILTRNGQFTEDLKKYAESTNVSKRIIFTGDLKNPHVATEISDVYTHITYGEGLPLALLEVMKMGKPIIASKVGGIPEAIRHPKEGILINNEIDELKSSIEMLVYNPKLRKKMSAISKRAVENRFSWEKTAKKLISVLER